ncbi:2-oxoacid:acceptor oxidoreductase subunit alpha [Candidatus Bathyarchaeota archaeon]|nr:MAG: 2-oxoacid:acceptor oxidoreductase subunit alpha [Candidatus Bathyarchaeota archaeon]TMI52860.1 MAG: 2-oxoacid:acceptor oxidoreductase subunit alpha [Candidatus Bathyarchaeota archaeon]
MIGGPQGSGINSVAENFAKACIRGGLHIFANIEYHSNIKGEHSYYRLRVESKAPRSHVDWIDLLVALDRETIFGDMNKPHPTHRGHRHEVSPGGGIIYDRSLNLTPDSFGRDDIKLFPIPYMDLLVEALKEFGKDKELSKYQVMVNTIALGASLGLADYDFDLATEAIREGFTGRKAALGDLNVSAAKRGYDYAKTSFGEDAFPIKLRKQPLSGKRMMIRGVQAVAIAKLKAGCGFQTYYPITPATDESEYLESHQKEYNMIVVQAEDEIAAINMATGAAHAGLRSSTSTSGPGFSLMAEGLGWAGITEAPGPVVILYQRAGPATGLPTRTEQADLRFALHAAHGEFPRIIIAPGDVVETYYDTFDAFNYAEHYQVPVILLTDKFLASTYQDIPLFNSDDLKVDRGDLLKESDLVASTDYRRYRWTELGISPRAIPGQKGGIFWTTGDEHDEHGHITEASDIRIKMMRKRMRKIELAGEVIPDSKKAILHGPKSAPVTLVGWGSSKGAILDGMEDLKTDGIETNFLQVRYVNPFPTNLVQQALGQARRKIAIENNYSAQMAGLIREKTGIAMDNTIVKFDGRPFSQNEIYEGVKDIIKNGIKEVTVSHA